MQIKEARAASDAARKRYTLVQGDARARIHRAEIILQNGCIGGCIRVIGDRTVRLDGKVRLFIARRVYGLPYHVNGDRQIRKRCAVYASQTVLPAVTRIGVRASVCTVGLRQGEGLDGLAHVEELGSAVGIINGNEAGRGSVQGILEGIFLAVHGNALLRRGGKIHTADGRQTAREAEHTVGVRHTAGRLGNNIIELTSREGRSVGKRAVRVKERERIHRGNKFAVLKIYFKARVVVQRCGCLRDNEGSVFYPLDMVVGGNGRSLSGKH